jgi:phosphate transport system permease protein
MSDMERRDALGGRSAILQHGGAARFDRLITLAVGTAPLLILAVWFWIVGYLVIHGWEALSWSFLWELPRDAGREGGLRSIVVATLLILGVALAASVPTGFGTAVVLSEYTRQEHALGRLLRRCLDVLAGVPSIVFGLFGNAVFCLYLGLGFSILSGGLTLACMILPILVRAIDEGLRAVPEEQRMGAAALGLSTTATLWHVLLPASLPNLLVGLVLGIGRALAETAALLFTSGYVDRMPTSLLDSGRALSVHIYDLSMNVPGGEPRAYGAALVLVILLLVINLTASGILESWMPRRRG